MAKNRNKKKKDAASMAIDVDNTAKDLPQAMDTSESSAPKHSLNVSGRKIKKGVQVKRSKNARRMKAIAKAVSLGEKSSEKVLKNESKTMRTQSAKKLYD